KITRVRITNKGETPRSLALVAWQRLLLGGRPRGTRDEIRTARDARTGSLFAERAADALHPARVTFAALVGRSAGYAFTCDGVAFLGDARDPSRPRALAAPEAFDGKAGASEDPCFAQRT